MPRTGFDPRAHGFHFANDFVDKVGYSTALYQPVPPPAGCG